MAPRSAAIDAGPATRSVMSWLGRPDSNLWIPKIAAQAVRDRLVAVGDDVD
jgi:hypothetical protein